MKKIFSVVISIVLSVTIMLFSTACFGGGNAYKQFVKQHGSYTNDIEVISGTESKEFVTDSYSLIGKFEVSTNGAFTARPTEKTMSKGTEMGSFDDTKIWIEFSVSYRQVDDLIIVSVFRYLKWEGSRSLNSANGLGEKYEFTDGFAYENTVEGNRFEFDANKYFDDNKLSVEDASKLLTMDRSNVRAMLQNGNLDAYLTNNPTWEEDAISDILDAVNATLSEIDKFIEEENK